jgi:hypothetical protein
MKHIERFGCAVGQIDPLLNVHPGQKWPTILYNNTDTLTAQADMQNSTKGQSSVSRYEFILAV